MEQPRIHPHHSVLLWQCSMQRSLILLEGVLLVDDDFTNFVKKVMSLTWIMDSISTRENLAK